MYADFGMVINVSKTEVMHCQPSNDPEINICGSELATVQLFKYRGSILEENASIDLDIQHRISNAGVAIRKLSQRVFFNKDTYRVRYFNLLAQITRK